MKKILVSLVILAMCAPAMAATTVDVAGGEAVMTITVTVTDDDVVRGLAVAVALANAGDGEIALDTGEFDVDAGGFNTFIDYAYSAGAGYTAVGQGHPIAQVGAAGEIVPAAGVQDFVVSAGFLDETSGQGGLDAAGSPYVITINMTGTADTDFACSLDTLRGGIVGDNLEVTDNTGTITVTAPAGTTCADLFAANTHYAAYVTAGNEPLSWCWQYQCRGDANGAVDLPAANWRIYTLDLGILSANWRKGPATGADPRADFNHAMDLPAANWAIYTLDLGILSSNWRKGDATLVVCPEYIAP
jgi:hypothetical protein